MVDELDVLTDKYEDIRDSAETDEYEIRSMAQEILDDIKWLKNLRK